MAKPWVLRVAISQLNIFNWHLLGVVVWSETPAGLRSGSYYQGCLAGRGPTISCSGHCWALADLEAGVRLGEVHSCFSVSACVCFTQMLTSGRNPHKGTWEGENVPLFGAAAFWPLHKSATHPKA